MLAATLGGACDAPDDLDDALVEDGGDQLDEEALEFRTSILTTGRRLNTNHSGNHWFSELDITGTPHEDTRLDHVDYVLDPSDPNSQVVTVDTSSMLVWYGELYAWRTDGQIVAGSDWNQTRWFIEAFQPGGVYNYELKVETAGYDAATGTPLYVFYYDLGYGEGWAPTCVMEGEENVLTAALYADLDVDESSGDMVSQSNLLYIGCTAGAVGKASLWGYRPDYGTFAWHYGSDPLAAFEASVRMLRADYCGDGSSWTLPGTGVYLKDKAGVNDSISGYHPWPGIQDEAVWDQDGAMCLDTPRVPTPFGMPVSCNGVQIQPCWFGAAGWFSDPSAMFWTAS